MLAVITCHFNYCGYTAPRANLRRFLRHLELCGVPVYGVEAIAPDQTPFTTDLPNWSQLPISPTGYLWQKERLLNLAERLVPPEYTQIAWLDADIAFSTPHWPQLLIAALSTSRIVQPFEDCHWTDREGRLDRSRQSVFRAGLTREWTGQPGFAMAAQRTLFSELGGLFDLCPTGNGDTVFAAAVTYPDAIGWLKTVAGCNGVGDNIVSLNRCRKWSARVHAWAQGSATYLPGVEVVHDWHGDPSHRIYLERCTWVQGLNTRRELTTQPNGLLEWTTQADRQRVQQIKGLFAHRREDG